MYASFVLFFPRGKWSCSGPNQKKGSNTAHFWERGIELARLRIAFIKGNWAQQGQVYRTEPLQVFHQLKMGQNLETGFLKTASNKINTEEQSSVDSEGIHFFKMVLTLLISPLQLLNYLFKMNTYQMQINDFPAITA